METQYFWTGDALNCQVQNMLYITTTYDTDWDYLTGALVYVDVCKKACFITINMLPCILFLIYAPVYNAATVF